MPSTEIELFWNATNLVRVVEAADRRLAILIDFYGFFWWRMSSIGKQPTMW
jgi:hypothetical protein